MCSYYEPILKFQIKGSNKKNVTIFEPSKKNFFFQKNTLISSLGELQKSKNPISPFKISLTACTNVWKLWERLWYGTQYRLSPFPYRAQHLSILDIGPEIDFRDS